ncbi:MAG TPA: vanadium-dependent haloperoxidase [Casimicrobiaceae bacterium]|nr:vanadium-dependent haloperoxidase [Casimicrobiaceae bacterium]
MNTSLRNGVLFAIIASAALSPSAHSQGFAGGIGEALGPNFGAAPHVLPPAATRRHAHSRIGHWHEIAIDASGLDHTPVTPGDSRIFGEQLGPARASRAMAIVHIAMFEAANAIDWRYRSYVGIPPASLGTSMDAAIAQAAHDTLIALFPSQQSAFVAALDDDLARAHGRPRERGIALGREAARRVLELRADDHSVHSEPRLDNGSFVTQGDAGKWRQDPISQIPLALGAKWGVVTPFVMESADQFLASPPPALGSAEYAIAFNEVRRLGGDGKVTLTERTTEQTEIGFFWAYDGTPSLCAPPRLYNQIAMQIAEQMGTRGVDLARLLALVNVAMADTGIATWHSKYFWQFWRPITGIRESDPGSSATHPGDGNDATPGDVTFSPLGAPASNLVAAKNFTPPFPAYPSGHAAFGGALFETLRQFYGRDDIAFTFMSDELNGITKDNEGNVRPMRPRSFDTFSQAEEENGQSRIYLGIHWSFDKTRGIEQGRSVARHVFAHAFRPTR